MRTLLALAAVLVASVASGASGHGRETCSTRSEADFPGAFTSSRNLVVGPFALIGGGAYTTAETVREFGGNKFPAVLRAGRTVTVRLAGRGRRLAGLAYGRLPRGEIEVEDAYRKVTFKACRRGGPSESSADGAEITFWSGFVLTTEPACIPLDVVVGDEPPVRVRLALGRRCGA